MGRALRVDYSTDTKWKAKRREVIRKTMELTTKDLMERLVDIAAYVRQLNPDDADPV